MEFSDIRIADLRDVIKTPAGEELYQPEADVVRLYADLWNENRPYISDRAKKAGGYLTENGDVNYSRFEKELRAVIADEEMSGFVAYKEGKPAGIIIYGPSAYPDNEFEEYVDIHDLPTMVYGMPGNSIQLKDVLFAPRMTEEDAKKFLILSLDQAYAFNNPEGLIVEADQENLLFLDILHDLGFEGKGTRGYEIGREEHKDRYYPMYTPHYDITQHKETAVVTYAPLEDVLERLSTDENLVVHPRSRVKLGEQDSLPRPPQQITGVFLK